MKIFGKAPNSIQKKILGMCILRRNFNKLSMVLQVKGSEKKFSGKKRMILIHISTFPHKRKHNNKRIKIIGHVAQLGEDEKPRHILEA